MKRGLFGGVPNAPRSAGTNGGLFGGLPNAPRSAGTNGGLFGGVPNAPRSAGTNGGLGGAGALDVDILNLTFRVVFLSEQKRPIIHV
jgi:hypothetical protein